MLADISDPIERFVAFIIEREKIRLRRERNDPWPWTDEPILQQYRFTNIHREDDKVSKHYQKTIRNRYGEHPLVFPGTMLYRWFNRPETCEHFFNQPDLMSNKSVFEHYMEISDVKTLLFCIDHIPPPHITGAYIITGKPGFSKGEGILHYFDAWCRSHTWEDQWNMWLQNPPLLSELDDWLDGEGLGSFMRAQIVADLKYLPFLFNASDWWMYASPGPGSMKGLNIVYGKPMNQAWTKIEWLYWLNKLNNTVTPMLEAKGIEKLHNQDMQSGLCEYSKFMKVMLGAGRPRQVFRHV